MSDTSTIVVICVGAAVVGVCLLASLLAALLDQAWRRWCDPAALAAADLTAQEEAAPPAPAPYLICAVCGAPALYPSAIGGVAPPFDWEGDWPPPPPRERSASH